MTNQSSYTLEEHNKPIKCYIASITNLSRAKLQEHNKSIMRYITRQQEHYLAESRITPACRSFCPSLPFCENLVFLVGYAFRMNSCFIFQYEFGGTSSFAQSFCNCLPLPCLCSLSLEKKISSFLYIFSVWRLFLYLWNFKVPSLLACITFFFTFKKEMGLKSCPSSYAFNLRMKSMSEIKCHSQWWDYFYGNEKKKCDGLIKKYSLDYLAVYIKSKYSVLFH